MRSAIASSDWKEVMTTGELYSGVRRRLNEAKICRGLVGP
jgi:hypothetical protein